MTRDQLRNLHHLLSRSLLRIIRRLANVSHAIRYTADDELLRKLHNAYYWLGSVRNRCLRFLDEIEQRLRTPT
jgi:hypothetical protein